MGVVVKQSFWSTVMTYIGVIVGYLNTLYFRTAYFDLSQIGIFTLVTSNAMIISTFSSLGTGSSFLKFFPEFKEENRNQVFSFLFLIAIIGATVTLILGFFFKGLIEVRYAKTAPTYINYLTITAMVIVANSFFELFQNYSRVILKIIFPIFLREIHLRVGSLLMVLGYALNWWDFDGAVLGLGLTYVTAMVFLYLQLFFFHQFRFDFSFHIITKKQKNNFFKFGLYSMLLALSFGLINNASNDQITAIIGPDATGIFTTCFFIAVIVEMPKRNMASVISPILSTGVNSNDFKQVSQLYKRSSITMSIIGSLLFIGISTNISDLFDYIPKGNNFENGFWVVMGVCLAKLLVMVSSFAGEIINFSAHYKYNLLFQVIAAVLLISLNSLLIPVFGINGAAISYLITISLHLIMKGVFVWMKFHIHPFVKEHWTLLVIVLLIGIIANTIQLSFHPIVNIFIRSTLTLISFVALVYRLKISEDINTVIRSTFERITKIHSSK